MSTTSNSAASSSVWSTAATAVERTVSELRFGRPVILKSSHRRFAALALDAASPTETSRFIQIAHQDRFIFLNGERARSLGLNEPGGVLIPHHAHDAAAIARLGYARGERFAGDYHKADATKNAMLHRLAELALLLPFFLVTGIDENDTSFDGCLSVEESDLLVADAKMRDFEVVARTIVPLKNIRHAEFVVFRGGLAQRDQVAIVVGKPTHGKPVPVRIHSSCLTGDLFDSLKCDCGDQLREGLALLERRGGGVLIYLDQEGRGTGIAAKMRAYGYQNEGLDTIDADAALGFGPDGRRYGTAVAMLRKLGIESVELLTNNPGKIAALEAEGLDVTARIPVLGLVTDDNRNYLETKARRAGHMLDINSHESAK